MRETAIETQVIQEFGEQWTKFTENTGYYASFELLKDLVEPLINANDFKDRVIAEVGSGTGRIINMLARAEAKHLVAIEPSAAMKTLQRNTSHLGSRITLIQLPGDRWTCPNMDFVVSFGVLHHIHDPGPTVQNMYDNLKPGGKALVWLYGREGNELYLRVFGPIRALTPKLSHGVLMALVWLLYFPLKVYATLSRFLPLPMRSYMRNHIGRLDGKTQRLTIYDQLNPTWAKYYTREEAESLLKAHGFSEVNSFHRHGYSWTVVGTKPA